MILAQVSIRDNSLRWSSALLSSLQFLWFPQTSFLDSLGCVEPLAGVLWWYLEDAAQVRVETRTESPVTHCNSSDSELRVRVMSVNVRLVSVLPKPSM